MIRQLFLQLRSIDDETKEQSVLLILLLLRLAMWLSVKGTLTWTQDDSLGSAAIK